MADVVIYGLPQSSYLRTVRMACREKGIDYVLEELAPHSPELLAYNPTGKMPGFRHGDRVLWETSAITRYLDDSFSGNPLQPEDIGERARMNLWISMINDVIYQVMIRDIILPRFGIVEADDAKLAEAGEKLDKQLQLIEQELERTPYLAGERLTLADLFLTPIIFWLEKTPEGGKLANYPALTRWYGQMSERPSFTATVPPMPG
ncbi:MAG: glutathione S-transferase family protein [Pseudomonadota bacterium]